MEALQRTGAARKSELEPALPAWEHENLPSCSSLLTPKETVGGRVALPAKDLKSWMPKAVAKQSVSARGDSKSESWGVDVGAHRESRAKRRRRIVLLMLTLNIMIGSLGTGG